LCNAQLDERFRLVRLASSQAARSPVLLMNEVVGAAVQLCDVSIHVEAPVVAPHNNMQLQAANEMRGTKLNAGDNPFGRIHRVLAHLGVQRRCTRFVARQEACSGMPVETRAGQIRAVARMEVFSCIRF